MLLPGFGLLIAVGFGALCGWLKGGPISLAAAAGGLTGLSLWKTRRLFEQSRQQIWGVGTKPTIASWLTLIPIGLTIFAFVLTVEAGPYWVARDVLR